MILITSSKDFYLLYNSVGFVEGVFVTGYLIYPDLQKGKVFIFDEMGDGIYSAKVALDVEKDSGDELMEKYGLVIKENGTVRKFEIFGFTVKRAEM